MARIETFLILTVAALDFVTVPRRIRADQLVPDARFGACLFKQHRQIMFAVDKAIGELKTIVCLDTFHLDAAACVSRRQFAKEIRRGVSRLLRVGGEKAQLRGTTFTST